MTAQTPSTASLAQPRKVLGSCQYCGNSNPIDAFVHSYEADGTAHRLYCTDEAACTARQDVEAARVQQRYSLTAAGYAYLAATGPIVRTTSQRGHYTCDSATTPGTVYNLAIDPDGRASCTCKGYEYRGICRHGRQLERVLSGRAVLVGAAA